MTENSMVAALFACFAVLALFGIVKPDAAVRSTAQYFKWSMRLFGFDCEVRATPRAAKICCAWNIFMLCVIAAALLAIARASK